MTVSSIGIGDYVRIQNLNSRPELNGRVGKVTNFEEQRERYHVDIESEVISLRATNVVLSMRGRTAGQQNQNQNQNNTYTGGGNNANTDIPKIDWTLVFSAFIIGVIFEIRLLHIFAGLAALVFGSIFAPNIFVHQPVISGIYEVFHRGKSDVENRLSVAFGMNIRMQVVTGCLAAVAFMYSFNKRSSSYDWDDESYFDGGYFGGYGGGFQGVSIISVIMLVAFLYKMDIPNNGLEGFRNLNFWQIMWLVNLLMDVFGGGHRGRRFGYGGRRRRW